MFLKRSARRYKGKVYESWHLVEAYRDGKKVRHRYLLNVSSLSSSQRGALKKVLENPDCLVVEDFGEFFREGIDYGQVVFFLYIMHRIGVIEVLRKHLSEKALVLIVAVLLNRVINPTSKLEAIDWIKDTVFPLFTSLDKEEFIVNRLYEAMDEVWENLSRIMEDFYHLSREKPVFLLYDITSTYFEGSKVRKARYGYSRDKRSDNLQVLLGLVLNERGFPVHFEIFEGNIQDKTTVCGVAKEIKKRYKVSRSIFIGDRGMITIKNAEELTDMGLGYILALRHEEAKELLKKEGIQRELFDKVLPIEIYRGEKEKYVLCGSPYRKEREEASFEVLLKNGRESLESVRKMVEGGRLKDPEKVIRRAERKLTRSGASRYYDFEYRNGKFEIIEKEEEIERARKLCGHYILKTTEIDMDPEKVEERYKSLQEVEKVFRDLKDLLVIRPIYHWKDRRVETHIYLCLLSQVILSETRKTLKRGGWLGELKENTLEKFIKDLNRIKLGKFKIGDKTIYKLQRENPLKDLLLLLFNIKPFEWTRDKKACSI
jgi:transposase